MTDTKKVDAWMPLWIGDYLADTMALKTAQHGAYLLLLVAYWRNKGPLPDDDEDLAGIVRASLPEWKKLRPKIERFFDVADGLWTHGRADKELDAAGLRKTKAVEKAKAAADARWAKQREQSSEHASGNAPSMPQAVLEHCPSPSPSPKTHLTGVSPAAPAPAPAAKRRKAIKTPIPDEFGISDRVRTWASEKGFEKLGEHLEAFVRKAKAKGYTYADWDLAFMEAVREDWAKLRSNGRGGAAAPAGERATVPSTAFEQTQEYLRRRELTPAEREAAERARLMVMSSIKVINGGNR